ncbi:MAG: cobyrinate a,c-diamide synthase [Caldimicrobium sp.]
MNLVFNIPRLTISSHRGGAGKTIFTLGLINLLNEKGIKIAPFKKGPDYIDAGWLSKIAEKPCRNLDLFLFDKKEVLFSFYLGSQNADIAILEGNRGLYDGVDEEGSCSTAELAKLLKSPVILVLDCTKATRSMAALVKGFMEFDKEIEIKGVILNNIARPRHEKIIRNSIERYTDAKVLGVIPRLKNMVKERHLGLVTHFEKDSSFLKDLRGKLSENVDLENIIELAKKVSPLEIPEFSLVKGVKTYKVKIGVFLDQAFQFYYPENFEFLQSYGAELFFINSFEERRLPSDISGLYLGGGFPEIFAQALAENKELKKDVKEAIESGMPVYAECGGLMYLGKEIEWQGKNFPMTGVLPIKFKVDTKPHGHGYVIARVESENPYFKINDTILGHEFHYSYPYKMELKKGMKFVFKLEKGTGLDGIRDGILYKNLFASYTHIHIFSVKYWAENFLELAYKFKNS